jgi:NADPH:quinone reductase-like Zn-dependent oxidoreductase
MKGVVFREFGGPDKLSVTTCPDPSPGIGEIVVRVAACGVNNVDLQIRRGARAQVPLPHICGGEIAGTVEALGEGTAGVRIGESVAIHPYLSCGFCSYCRQGRPMICNTRDTIGLMRPGGYAELVAVPARNAVLLPDGMNPVEAAALTLAGLTAWHMLVSRAKVRPGESVLVLAAASGVGSIGIQVARMCGARVITTASVDAKRAQAFALGADYVIDARGTNWSAEVRELTGGEGVDVVLEHVGAATFVESVKSLTAGGRLVTCGATTGQLGSLDFIRLFSDELTVLGSRGGTADELNDLLRAAGTRAIKPVIAEAVPLNRAADAHRTMERGDFFGKIVLVP